jgi:hypothetical protein
MIDQALKTIKTLLPISGSVTLDAIEGAVNIALSIPQYKDINKDILIREIQANFNIVLEDFTTIERKPDPWVYNKTSIINWAFWERYRDYLQIEKNYANTVTEQINKLTNKTLDGLFDPTIKSPATKYGLVVGQVQSGKTSNYTGLICKAVDSGFNLIIVLAGTLNNLRTQTQIRIDEGFLGFDSQFQRAYNTGQHTIGVGIGRNALPVHSVTSSANAGDFSDRTTLTFHTNEPIIAVVKKTKPRLEKLNQWLASQASTNQSGERKITNKTLLLIDDEADHASINTSKENDPATTTNRLIREIIGLFDKVGYVGYTATPFANIFIPIEDDQLFPDDFIINIPAPSNYIGPDKVFGFTFKEDADETSETVLPVVNRIDDYLNFIPDRHKKADLHDWKTTEDVFQEVIDSFRSKAPKSLEQAVRCFIITCSIRRLRGQKEVHNSMLIHISRFNNWQKVIFKVVEEIFNFYKRGIEMEIPSILKELQETFENDSKNYKSFVTTSSSILNSELKNLDPNIEIHKWEDVQLHLYDAVTRIQIREINGGSKDVLNYFDHKSGLSVIAIGGDKLSRGLTLDGLSVSYYLRASKMYDTLMQMGRWFGYRHGYTDLCRLFTSREINEWFCHITLASEELRNEFDYMSDVAGATPRKYALKVRNHPGVLQISASNKIRSAVDVNISWAGRLIESYEFKKDKNVISSNLTHTKDFIKQLPLTPKIVKNNYLWYAVPASNIRYFLQKFQLSDSLKAADPSNILRFIDAQLQNNELTNWTVAIMSKKAALGRENVDLETTSLDIGFFLRRYYDQNSDNETYFLRKSHIISPSDEFIDLNNDQYAVAMERTRQLWIRKNKEGQPSYPNGEIVRNEIRHPQKPLLLIYFLDPEGANRPEDIVKITQPIVGYAISFPGSKFNASVSYKIPEQLLPFFDQDYETEQNDDDDED